MRQSNIELLRIISIFFILIVHADFLVIGTPTFEELQISPTATITRIFFEMISIICVDVFVIISGWFGIHASLKGLCKLLFQVVFILTLIYVCTLVTKQSTFSIWGILGIFMLDEYFWFVKAYIILFILSPTINVFANNASKETIAIILIAFYCFQTIYAWLTDAATFINHGYCATSLSALYLLGRYLKRCYDDGEKVGQKGSLIITDKIMIPNTFCRYKYLNFYFLIVAINTGLFIVSYYVWGGGFFRPRLVYYTSPLVILQSIFFFLFFLNCNLSQNKFVNWVAASSFAVFIVHVSQGLKFYRILVAGIYDTWSGFTCIALLFVAMVAVFLLSILIDQLRIYIWNRISARISNFKIEQI